MFLSSKKKNSVVSDLNNSGFIEFGKKFSKFATKFANDVAKNTIQSEKFVEKPQKLIQQSTMSANENLTNLVNNFNFITF